MVASIYTGAVRAYDVTRVLQRDGNPTPLGEAIQHYGRIFKSQHILALIDDEGYRRDTHWIRNLQEGRHALARKLFHGSKGELYQRYREGMEDQLGALGLVLNCIVLWNTVYINAALEQLRAAGYPVLDQDTIRLHPFMRRHIAVQGDYSFLLPALDGRLRELRDPTESPRTRTTRSGGSTRLDAVVRFPDPRKRSSRRDPFARTADGADAATRSRTRSGQSA